MLTILNCMHFLIHIRLEGTFLGVDLYIIFIESIDDSSYCNYNYYPL